MNVRVASYNIRLGLEQGLSAVAATLRAQSPDCVALQEIGRDWVMGEPIDQVATLARELELAHWSFCPTIQRGGSLFGHALLSRFPLRESGRFDLPRTRDEPRRAAAHLMAIGSLSLPVVSLHLSHLDDERVPQVAALRRWISSRWPTGPLLLLGDLNEPFPDEQIPGWPLLDCHDVGLADRQPTFPAREPVDRRDVILVRAAVEATPVTVLESLASDHRPIVTTVVW